jgi:hypothetical protein
MRHIFWWPSAEIGNPEISVGKVLVYSIPFGLNSTKERGISFLGVLIGHESLIFCFWDVQFCRQNFYRAILYFFGTRKFQRGIDYVRFRQGFPSWEVFPQRKLRTVLECTRTIRTYLETEGPSIGRQHEKGI